jgi:hypothetical protein
MRDYDTGNHTRRVTDYSLLLADELRVTAAERYHIQIGGPLHGAMQNPVAEAGGVRLDDGLLARIGLAHLMLALGHITDARTLARDAVEAASGLGPYVELWALAAGALRGRRPA